MNILKQFYSLLFGAGKRHEELTSTLQRVENRIGIIMAKLTNLEAAIDRNTTSLAGLTTSVDALIAGGSPDNTAEVEALTNKVIANADSSDALAAKINNVLAPVG